MALMECVRGERPGVFNNRLFSRVLGVLLGSEGTAPEVLGLLIGRFLGGCWVGLLLCVAPCCSVLLCAMLCCIRGAKARRRQVWVLPGCFALPLRLTCRYLFCWLLLFPLQSWQMFVTSRWLASSG
jgi:hypothetical protein